MNYIKVKTFEELCNLPQKFEIGAVAQCEETEKIYYYTEKGWKEAEGAKIDDGLSLNLYDLNKNLVAQLPPLTKKELQNYVEELDEYHDAAAANYYMLLCHDYRYYTILHFNPESNYDSFGKTVIDCLNNAADIISMEFDKEQNTYEIWVRIDEQIYVFYLFEYDRGVVDFK